MSGGNRFSVKAVDRCRICREPDLVPYLDLGDQPPANSFIARDEIDREESFPLRVALCTGCGLSQLLHVVSAGDIFDEYLYLSSTSKALSDHYQGLVDSALAAFGPTAGALIVDIGCNDGIMLNRYPKDRFRLLGVEPSSAGAYAREAGHHVVSEFFDRTQGARLAREHGEAAIITATNVFAHVDDIRSFAAGVESLLADDGVFILEFPYLEEMLHNLYFDTIYHEHLSYLALTPLERLFAVCGLRAFDVERVEVGASGPALRLFVCRDRSPRPTRASIAAMLAAEADAGVMLADRYHAFAERVGAARDRILGMIGDLRRDGVRIGAYCAPAKGNTLLNVLGLTRTEIVAVSDNNPLKIGKVTPGTHIPIISDEAFTASDITHALLLAWNYADFFLARSPFVKRGGRFLIPLPDPHLRP